MGSLHSTGSPRRPAGWVRYSPLAGAQFTGSLWIGALPGERVLLGQVQGGVLALLGMRCRLGPVGLGLGGRERASVGWRLLDGRVKERGGLAD
jgi:hypothetical protein